MAGACTEVEPLDKAARAEAHDVVKAPGVYGDLAGPSTSWEAGLGGFVVAYDRGVEVAEAVHLRAAEQSDLDQPTLQIEPKQISHRDGRGRARDERRIADG